MGTKRASTVEVLKSILIHFKLTHFRYWYITADSSSFMVRAISDLPGISARLGTNQSVWRRYQGTMDHDDRTKYDSWSDSWMKFVKCF